MLIAWPLLQCRRVNQDHPLHPQKVYVLKDCRTSGADFLPLSVYRSVIDSNIRLPLPHCVWGNQVSTWHGEIMGPTYGKIHTYTEHSLNHWPSYLSVLLNQYIGPVPTRHIIYPENIWNSYKALSSSILQKLPQKTYCYQWASNQNKW